MRATLIHGAGDIRIADVPDPTIQTPTDALVRITTACICGSDLHPYGSMGATDHPERIGHEFIGVVEDSGNEVFTIRKGDLVVAPFAHWARDGVDGGQGEAARVPDRDALNVLVTP